MHWRKYYKVVSLQEVIGAELLPSGHREILGTFWAIVYSDDNANPGAVAYDKDFRTQRHAERAAARLYKREHGAMEDAIFGSEK